MRKLGEGKQLIPRDRAGCKPRQPGPGTRALKHHVWRPTDHPNPARHRGSGEGGPRSRGRPEPATWILTTAGSQVLSKRERWANLRRARTPRRRAWSRTTRPSLAAHNCWRSWAAVTVVTADCGGGREHPVPRWVGASPAGSPSPAPGPAPSRGPAHLDLLAGQVGGVEAAPRRPLPGPLEGLQVEVVGGAVFHVMSNPESCVPCTGASERRRLGGAGGGRAGRDAGQRGVTWAVTWAPLLSHGPFQNSLVAGSTGGHHPSEGHGGVPQHPLRLGSLALLDGLIDGGHAKSHWQGHRSERSTPPSPPQAVLSAGAGFRGHKDTLSDGGDRETPGGKRTREKQQPMAVPGGEGAVKEGFLEEAAWGGLGKGQSALRSPKAGSGHRTQGSVSGGE